MQDERDYELESRVQALLGGDLSREETDEILLRIAREDRARTVLRESIELRDRSRAAFGYARADEAMRASMAAVIASVERPERTVPARPWRGARALRAALVPLLVAVVLVGSASVYVAVLSHANNRMLRYQLAAIRASLEFPKITDAQRDGYRRIWASVSDDPNGPAPWVLLSEDGGQFGYLPRGSVRGPRHRLILVRFLMATPEGRQVGTVDFLVPAGRDLRLSVPQAGRLAGLPVSCEIATSDDWAAVGLSVGKRTAGGVGVRGRVSIGRQWREIGEFRLDGRRMRVAVQALPLDRAVG